MNQTQTEKVLQRIQTHGYIDNFYAMQNYILRLGARINDLKKQGYKIYGKTGKELNYPKSMHKNYYYFLEGSQNDERPKILNINTIPRKMIISNGQPSLF